MSVHVTVMPAAIPPHLRTEEITRQLNYNDGLDVEFVFEVLPSGALVVWKGNPGSDVGSAIELVYGPAAWESVQGTPRRDTLN
ncbi:hypothetical protein [Streptacidiphilus jiangxiensis]|uniref:Uncharacterized protein n=1 Tax=Streptacidiphilus jiangxiensis TaxID=235985 RepID=A0A1H7QIV6_STRJI|nr:hypothetical protein [Streptacidiphilus jiangxiensis]SEL47856.1 hypothetical protein SAMN05414137_10946 [Streptacidiphilus jiangxiensis]